MKLRKLFLAASESIWQPRESDVYFNAVTKESSELLDYLRSHAIEFIALIEAARVVAKIADRDTVEFGELHAALQPFDEQESSPPQTIVEIDDFAVMYCQLLDPVDGRIPIECRLPRTGLTTITVDAAHPELARKIVAMFREEQVGNLWVSDNFS